MALGFVTFSVAYASAILSPTVATLGVEYQVSAEVSKNRRTKLEAKIAMLTMTGCGIGDHVVLDGHVLGIFHLDCP